MSRYLVSLKPLEPYFFGNERRLQFPGHVNRTEEGIVKSEYYIESEDVPSQITLIGLLRFLVLKKEGKLTGEKLENGLKKEQEILVGRRGFQFGTVQKGNYGKIKSVGSLFLMDENNRYFVPCPLNHCKKDSEGEYEPFQMEQLGEHIFPSNFDAKAGLSNDYVCLDEKGTIVKWEDIFCAHEQVGIQKESEQKSFFKRKYKMLKSGYRFAFFAEMDEEALTKREVITMGQQKTPFFLEVKKWDEDLGQKIRNLNTIDLNGYSMYYAVSPVIFMEKPSCIAYYISKNKLFQCLQQNQNQTGHIRSKLYEIVAAGSIFYIKNEREEEFIHSYQNENYENIGLNHIVKLGGNKS